MGQKKLLLISALLITIMYSCNSSNWDNDSNSDTNDKMETTSASEASSTTASKVKFAPFKNIDDVRQKLSAVGIGELGSWRDDQMGGYMSITSYYQFGGGDQPSNLAYYLAGDNSSSIKTLEIVLNINHGDKKRALSKFGETIRKTYKAVGLEPDTKIINELKFGKLLKSESGTYKARTEVEKSGTETWKFLIETK